MLSPSRVVEDHVKDLIIIEHEQGPVRLPGWVKGRALSRLCSIYLLPPRDKLWPPRSLDAINVGSCVPFARPLLDFTRLFSNSGLF